MYGHLINITQFKFNPKDKIVSFYMLIPFGMVTNGVLSLLLVSEEKES